MEVGRFCCINFIIIEGGLLLWFLIRNIQLSQPAINTHTQILEEAMFYHFYFWLLLHLLIALVKIVKDFPVGPEVGVQVFAKARITNAYFFFFFSVVSPNLANCVKL